MKNKIIKSKRINGGILELVKFIDDFDKIIKYETVLSCTQKGIAGGAGDFKKVEEFENEGEAIKFFNSKN